MSYYFAFYLAHAHIQQACDNGVPVMCANTTVIVDVDDFNDVAPQFDLTRYEVDIFDDYVANTVLMQPVAIDRDSGVNGEIIYSLRVSYSVMCCRLSLYLVSSFTSLGVSSGGSFHNLMVMPHFVPLLRKLPTIQYVSHAPTMQPCHSSLHRIPIISHTMNTCAC